MAPDLPTLLAGWRHLPAGWSAVTAEGDLADGRGLVALRGRADPPGGTAARQLARRREVAEELAGLEPAYAEAADHAAAAVAEAAAAERRRAELQRLADEADADARRRADDAVAADHRLERVVADAERLTSTLAELDASQGEEVVYWLTGGNDPDAWVTKHPDPDPESKWVVVRCAGCQTVIGHLPVDPFEKEEIVRQIGMIRLARVAVSQSSR